MEGRTYLASDLAGDLGLPRSTINDWLVRYADYLEVETRGKRKVYSTRSLRILKEIAEMRNAGKNSFEIEQLLAARYGIRPEVAAPHHVAEPETAEEEGGETLPAAPESGLPATRPAFEQMTVQINAEFLKLAARLEDAEGARRRLIHRMWAVTAALVVGLAALLLVLALMMYQMFGRLEKKNRETADALSRETGEKFGEMAVVLDGSRQDFQENIARLKEELADQRKSFEAKLREMEASSANRAEAQILRFKEEFARRQQEELKRIEELGKTVRETAAAQLEAAAEAKKRKEAEIAVAADAKKRQEAAAAEVKKRKEAEAAAAEAKKRKEAEAAAAEAKKRKEAEAAAAAAAAAEKAQTAPAETPKPADPAATGAK